MNKFEKTEEIVSQFIEINKERVVSTMNPIPMLIDPQRIVAINGNYSYPEILNDYKMKILKESIEKNGWLDEYFLSINLLQMPNGDLLVNGCGNHRSVLSKELKIPQIKAYVAVVKYMD